MPSPKLQKKRKMDAAAKTPLKRTKVPGKRKGETMKVVVPQRKTSLKRPSDADVASVRPVK
jgi:hypothetical protein